MGHIKTEKKKQAKQPAAGQGRDPARYGLRARSSAPVTGSTRIIDRALRLCAGRARSGGRSPERGRGASACQRRAAAMAGARRRRRWRWRVGARAPFKGGARVVVARGCLRSGRGVMASARRSQRRSAAE